MTIDEIKDDIQRLTGELNFAVQMMKRLEAQIPPELGNQLEHWRQQGQRAAAQLELRQTDLAKAEAAAQAAAQSPLDAAPVTETASEPHPGVEQDAVPA